MNRLQGWIVKILLPRAIKISSLAAETTGYQHYWQVKVNGTNLDLAYTYLSLPNSPQAVNLAGLVKCPVRGVSPLIEPR